MMDDSPKIALDKLFSPRSVAVAGASGNVRNLGSRTLKRIKDFGFTGELFAVNPKGESSADVPGVRRIVDISGPVDLCIVAVPAAAVAQVITDCVDKGVPVAQILTSGFGEAGASGRKAEKAILQTAAGRTRLVGPNCMGLYSATGGLTLIASAEKTAGTVSIASQSGGLSIDMVLQAKSRGLKLSKLVSMGNCMDLDPVDFLDYFRKDPETEVIGLYLEGINRGREFYRSLAETTPKKPVVVLKGGRTPLGAKSAASHTNALAGEDATWQALVLQAGAVTAEDVDDFLSLLTAFQRFVPIPRGNGIALIGNGGGSTVLATDLMAQSGLNLAVLADPTETALKNSGSLPGATIGNPSDIPINALNKSGGETLGVIISGLLKDDSVDAVVIHFNLLALMNYDNRQEIAEGISQTLLAIDHRRKPIYLALRATPDPALEETRRRILSAAGKAGLPCFTSANEAVRALAAVYHRSKSDRIDPVASTPRMSADAAGAARKMLQRIKASGLTLVPQDVAFAVLDRFGIPHPGVRKAKRAADAATAAAGLGFPVVLKIDSPDISHKTEAGGIRLNLKSENDVAAAFDQILRSARDYRPDAVINGVLVQAALSGSVQEIICGIKRDPVFGPVVLLGTGGVLVEFLRDVSLKISPLTAADAPRMWREITGSRLLTGYRGQPRADTEALEALLLRVSALAEALPEVQELDLNPVMVMPEGRGVSVVDCRILLGSQSTTDGHDRN